MSRLLALLVLVPFAACADADAPGAETTAAAPSALGQAVPGGEALTPDELIAGADDYAGQTVVVEGVAREVCQMEGCWLTFADDAGQTVRVSVAHGDSDGYAFTFPTDAGGQTVRVAGQLAVETESVESQRHYATDGGASPEEVAAITEPKRSLVFTALGAEVVGRAEAAGRADA